MLWAICMKYNQSNKELLIRVKEYKCTNIQKNQKRALQIPQTKLKLRRFWKFKERIYFCKFHMHNTTFFNHMLVCCSVSWSSFMQTTKMWMPIQARQKQQKIMPKKTDLLGQQGIFHAYGLQVHRNRNACHLTHFIFLMNLGLGPAKIRPTQFPKKKKSILSSD